MLNQRFSRRRKRQRQLCRLLTGSGRQIDEGISIYFWIIYLYLFFICHVTSKTHTKDTHKTPSFTLFFIFSLLHLSLSLSLSLSPSFSLSLLRARKSNGIFAGCRDPRFSIDEVNSIDGVVPNFGVVVINQSPEFSSPLACKCSFYLSFFVFRFLLCVFPFEDFGMLVGYDGRFIPGDLHRIYFCCRCVFLQNNLFQIN